MLPYAMYLKHFNTTFQHYEPRTGMDDVWASGLLEEIENTHDWDRRIARDGFGTPQAVFPLFIAGVICHRTLPLATEPLATKALETATRWGMAGDATQSEPLRQMYETVAAAVQTTYWSYLEKVERDPVMIAAKVCELAQAMPSAYRNGRGDAESIFTDLVEMHCQLQAIARLQQDLLERGDLMYMTDGRLDSNYDKDPPYPKTDLKEADMGALDAYEREERSHLKAFATDLLKLAGRWRE